jgi:hypothetical protein
LKRLNFSFFSTVTRLKPGANEMFSHNRSKIKMHHGHSGFGPKLLALAAGVGHITYS